MVKQLIHEAKYTF